MAPASELVSGKILPLHLKQGSVLAENAHEAALFATTDQLCINLILPVAIKASRGVWT